MSIGGKPGVGLIDLRRRKMARRESQNIDKGNKLRKDNDNNRGLWLNQADSSVRLTLDGTEIEIGE